MQQSPMKNEDLQGKLDTLVATQAGLMDIVGQPIPNMSSFSSI
jgi:hypothetical protein